VKLLEVIGERLPLRWSENAAHVTDELYDAFGSLLGELHVRLARRFQGITVNGGLSERLHELSVSRLRLCMQGHEVAHCLFHERVDLRLLGGGGINLHVKMLEHVVDVRRDVCGVAGHHHSVVEGAHAGPLSQGDDACGQSRAGDEGNDGVTIQKSGHIQSFRK
jgi:hypothetical protein